MNDIKNQFNLTNDDWCYEDHCYSVEEPLEENVFWAKVDQFNNIINRNVRADDNKLFALSQELGV